MGSLETDARVPFWHRVEQYLDSLVRPGSGLDLRGQVERIRTLTRAFYAYVLFLAFPWASAASAAWTSREASQAEVHVDVAGLIPVEHWDSAQVAGCLVLIFGSLLLCVQPRLRWPRICVALAFVVTTAVQFDLRGKIEHGNHPAIWMAIALCFLCTDGGGAAAQRRYVASFLGVQALICTLYTSAGVCKLIGTFYDRDGGVTWFHPEALPYMITGNWERSSTTLLGGFFVLNPGLSALCQLAAFALEIGALPAVFVRHLQRPWAILLITMHVMILHSMKIHFHQSCFILMLAVVASPYAPSFRSSASLLASSVRDRRAKWRAGVAKGGPASDAEGAAGSAAAPGARGMFAPGALDRSRGARWARLWGPLAAAAYLLIAFSRFEPSRGAFRPEIYPIAPMAMFFQLHPSAEGLEKVKRLRVRLERDGLFPERAQRFRPERPERPDSPEHSKRSKGRRK